MKFSYLTKEQFSEMLDAQISLNEKYSGKEWVDIPDSSLIAATYAELGELLESGPRVGDDIVGWKWWKPYLEDDVNNKKIEAVDIIHFVLSAIYKKYNQDAELLKNHYGECSNAYATSSDLKDKESSGVVYDLIVSLNVLSVACLVPDTDKEQAMDMFVFLVNSLCDFAEMTADEMYELYFKKNKLNQERVEGGYKENKYEKYDADGNEDNTKLFD